MLMLESNLAMEFEGLRESGMLLDVDPLNQQLTVPCVNGNGTCKSNKTNYKRSCPSYMLQRTVPLDDNCKKLLVKVGVQAHDTVGGCPLCTDTF